MLIFASVFRNDDRRRQRHVPAVLPGRHRRDRHHAGQLPGPGHPHRPRTRRGRAGPAAGARDARGLVLPRQGGPGAWRPPRCRWPRCCSWRGSPSTCRCPPTPVTGSPSPGSRCWVRSPARCSGIAVSLMVVGRGRSADTVVAADRPGPAVLLRRVLRLQQPAAVDAGRRRGLPAQVADAGHALGVPPGRGEVRRGVRVLAARDDRARARSPGSSSALVVCARGFRWRRQT